jgi:hypothetical protein
VPEETAVYRNAPVGGCQPSFVGNFLRLRPSFSAQIYRLRQGRWGGDSSEGAKAPSRERQAAHLLPPLVHGNIGDRIGKDTMNIVYLA